MTRRDIDFGKYFSDNPINDVTCNRRNNPGAIGIGNLSKAVQHLKDKYQNTQKTFENANRGCMPVFCYPGGIAVDICNDRERARLEPVMLYRFNVALMMEEILVRWEADDIWQKQFNNDQRKNHQRPCVDSDTGTDASLIEGKSGPRADPWWIRVYWALDSTHKEECVTENSPEYYPQGGKLFGEGGPPAEDAFK